MLERLYIQNYAIIDELAISFSDRLNILTGETGAGKSIIMGALGLILGQRADSSVLVNSLAKCVVEGQFRVQGKKDVLHFLRENDLDETDELILRREISASGKSRSFVNDTPVNLAQLKELSERLVDLHQQFDTLELRESEFQREVLDILAGNLLQLENFRKHFAAWQAAVSRRRQLQEEQAQAEKEAGYNRFQLTELEEAAFRENELEEAEAGVRLLQHAEDINAVLQQVTFELKDSEEPLLSKLKSVQQRLQAFRGYLPALPALLERLDSVQIELRDITAELDDAAETVQADPERLARLNERLSLGYRLQKKHGVSSTAALLEIQAQLQEKLQHVSNLEISLAEAAEAEAQAEEEVQSLAVQLRIAREKVILPVAEKVNGLLAQVGMPNARFKVLLLPAALHPGGSEQVQFLLDANLPAGKKEEGGHFLPLGKAASGGELSRLMLCIKSLVAGTANLSTLIFDEIDTGISGEAARQVGIIMKQLAARRQVICITHQPQIAGKADAHYYVYKEKQGDRILTGMRRLNTEERISAIARMLGGESPSSAALQNAREMVQADG